MSEAKQDLDVLRPPFMQRNVIRRTVALGAAACMCLSGGTATSELRAEDELRVGIGETADSVRPAPEPEQIEEATLNIPWLPSTVQRFEDYIVAAGQRHQVEPELIALIMTLESGGWVGAESPVAAQGLMQIWPPTEKFIASELGYSEGDYNVYDPKTNIEFGAWYLAHVAGTQSIDLEKPLDGRAVRLISAGYNGGPGRATDLRKAGLRYEQASLPRETELYSTFAVKFYHQRNQERSAAFEEWHRPREEGGFGGHELIEKAQQPR